MQDEIEESSARAVCRRFEIELPAYLEGEQRPTVTQHARECRFCAVVLADLERVRSACQGMPLEEPPAGLWANLRVTLAAEGVIREQAKRPGGWFPHFAWGHLAAPALALACLALFGVLLLVPSNQLDRMKGSGWLALGDRTKVASDVYALEDGQLAQTVEELQKNFEAREASLTPAVKATYRAGLESLNASIEECRASVEREPGDTLARQYLVAAYTQKAEVLAAALQFDVR